MYDLNDNNSDQQDQPRGLWETWSRRRILALAFFLAFGNFYFQVLFFSIRDDLFVPVLAGAIAGVFLPVIWMSQKWDFSLRRDFGLFLPHPAALGGAALLAVCSLVPTSLLAEFSLRLFPVDGEWVSFYQEHLPTTGYEIFLAVITVVVMAPLAEEILFRGLLQRVVSLRLGPLVAVVISATVFGASHMQWWFLFGLVGVGFMLAFIFETTGSVLACWVAHAVHNAISLWAMLGSDDIQVEPRALSETDWVLAAASVLGLLVVGKFLLAVGKRTT